MQHIEAHDAPEQLAPANRCDSFQQALMYKLKSALRESNLLNEVSGFKYINDLMAKDHCSLSANNCDINPGAMLRVKRASEIFVQLTSSLPARDVRALPGLELAGLLTKRFWLQLLLASQRSKSGQVLLDAAHKKLVFIESYQTTTKHHKPAQHMQEVTVENSISSRRYCALTAFSCGTLTLGLSVIVCATLIPEKLQLLTLWSLSSGVSFPTTTALLVLMLAVSSFHFITNMSTLRTVDVCAQDRLNTGSTAGEIVTASVSPRRVITGCTGPLVLGLGAGLSTTTDLGAFGVTVFVDGMFSTYAMPYWVTQIVLTICCYLTAWRWAQIPLGAGTLPSLLLIGPAVSLGASLTPQDLTFAGDILVFLIATMVLAFGVAMSSSAALGPDGLTALSLSAEKKNLWSIPLAAFFFNLTFISVGIALGGSFGVATILNLLLLPVLLRLFIPPMRRLLGAQPIRPIAADTTQR